MSKGLWSGIPAVPVFISVIGGIVLALWLQPTAGQYGVGLVLVLLALAGRYYGFWPRRWRIGLLIAAVVAASLCSRQMARHALWAEQIIDGQGLWHGVLLPVDAVDGTTEWRLRLTKGQAWGQPYVVVVESEFHDPLPSSLWDDLQHGAVVEVGGTLRAPARAGNPGEFDFRRYAYMRHLVGTVYVDSIHVVTLRVSWLDRLRQKGAAVRTQLQQYIRGAVERHASPLASQVMVGMITGSTAQLDSEIETVFRRVGISHLLAVSGLHVGLVLALVLGILKLIPWKPRARIAIAGVVMWGFVVLAGARPSALRAGLMATLSLIAYELRRRVEPLQFWALAGIGILLWQPLHLLQAGFQLSFAASGAILLAVPHLQPLTGEKTRWHHKAWALGGVSLAAQIGTLLPLAYHFNELSLVGLPVNIVAVPVAGPVLSLALLGVVVGTVSQAVGGLLLRLSSLIIDLSWPILQRVADLPWAMLEVAAPSVLTTGIVVAAIVGTMWYWGKQSEEHVRWGRHLLIGALVASVAAVWLPIVNMMGGTIRIMFIDVGQGDAILIQTPRGRTVLIDGGGSPRRDEGGFYHIGERRLLPLLQHLGIKTVDVVINTHPDEDHLQGLVTVLNRRHVGLMLDSGRSRDTITYAEYEAALSEAQIPRVAARRGHVIVLDEGIELHVLHPGEDPPGGRNENEHSVVIRLVTDYGTALFTGDLPNAAQQELLWSAPNVNVQADVIKVPHHGSGRDVQWRFIDAVSPTVAVIQVGRNGYGHPAPETVRAYVDRQAIVYRTDHHGMVTVTMARRGIRVHTFHSR